MTRRNRGLVVAMAALAAAPAAAQDNAELERQARIAAPAAERAEARAEMIDVQLREAEEQLAEAAARVAELSRSRLPEMAELGRRMHAFNRPVLGVTISSGGDDDGPAEGVTVRGVTPGSAAADAGLRAGDVLTAVNDESLSASTASEANDKLLEFMSGVDEGDTLDVQYLRDGRRETVEIEPRPGQHFAWAFGDRGWRVPAAPAAPHARFFAFHNGGSWGDMEMVSLTEGLGRYFGTDDGLLVVRAPKDENLKLKDGDVIQRIDGREPNSVSHAMRILGSYQGGESLEIEIMRDRKRETLSIEVPDHRQGSLRRFRLAAPLPESEIVPAPPAPPVEAPGDRI